MRYNNIKGCGNVMTKGDDKLREYLKLKGWMTENKVKQKDLAELLGKNVPTVNRKLNGKSKFDVDEIRLICETYGLSADVYFFE